MAISQTDIMNRATRIANGAGMDPERSAFVDNAYLFEDFFKIALRAATCEQAAEIAKRGALRRSFSMTLVAGEATLDDDVLDEFVTDSTCFASTDTDLLVSFEPRWNEYLRAGNAYRQIGYFTIYGGKLCYRGPGDDVGTSTATVTLNAIAMPAIPASITDPLAITSDLAELTAIKLAALVRGELAAAKADKAE